MGKCDYSQIGYGFTEREARRDAIEAATEEYGHHDGYSGQMNSAISEKSKCILQPKRSKTCKVEKVPQKGARKWETIFIVEPVWASTGGKTVILKNSTQAKALTKGKELVLEHHCEYKITIDKMIVQGNAEVARITPKKSQKGKWEFTGEAKD